MHFSNEVLPYHKDTAQDIYHLQRRTRMIEPKRRAALNKLDDCKTMSHSKVPAEKHELHHDPASFAKYGEGTAPINKSLGKTLL